MNKRIFWKISVDGASRNNPGPAGAGIYISNDQGFVQEYGFFVGIKTNNQAEYLALILGLLCLNSYVKSQDLVLVYSDSELMIKQLKGHYKVKNVFLQHLNGVALQLLSHFDYDVVHVPRALNAKADALANLGVDKKIGLPDSIQVKLHEYAINL